MSEAEPGSGVQGALLEVPESIELDGDGSAEDEALADAASRAPVYGEGATARPDLGPLVHAKYGHYVAKDVNDSLPTNPLAPPEVAVASARKPTDVRAAVQWNGSWKQPFDGTAIITRRYANALDQSGIPVFMPASGSYSRLAVDRIVTDEVETLIDRTPLSQPVHLHHLVPTEASLRAALYPGNSAEMDPEGAEERHRRKILLSVWEQMPIGDWRGAWVAQLLCKFAHHIVPCSHNAEVLRRAGVPDDKITIIHHPFSVEDAHALSEGKGSHEPDPAHYRFYTMGKWEPRKQALAVMVAFLRTWRALRGVAGAPRITLTVVAAPWYTPPRDAARMGLRPYPALEDAIARASEDAGVHVEIARELITIDSGKRASQVEFHVAHDCFVTASHGEAWGMPCHDAVLAENHVLAPKWGGFEAYLPGEGLPFRMVPIRRDNLYLYGSQKAEWAEVIPEALVEAMTSAAVHRTRGVPFSNENFDRQNPAAVGKQLRAVVEKVIGPGYAWR